MAMGRKTGGRGKGTPNKATASLRDIARQYTSEGIERLMQIIRSSDSDAAVVSAIKELLDRGHGKATQVLAGDADGGPIKVTRIELVALTGE